MKQIKLTQGQVALVDDADFERLKKYKWYAVKDGNTYYAKTCNNGKHIKMHRFILNPLPKFECDHINHNGLDNRRCNLRICTTALNQANQRRRNIGSSKYRGVRRRGCKWVAAIGLERTHLGRFNTEIEAAKAYDIAAKKRYGCFAQSNF